MLQRAEESQDLCLKNGNWDDFSNYHPTNAMLRASITAKGPLSWEFTKKI